MSRKSRNKSHRSNTITMFLLTIFLLASVTLLPAAGGRFVLLDASATQGALLNAICPIFNTLSSIIFILALTLFMVGGAVYAGANMLPGSQRGGIQAYAMGLIMGSVVGLILVIGAPWVLNIVIQVGQSSAGSSGLGSLSTNGACGVNLSGSGGGGSGGGPPT